MSSTKTPKEIQRTLRETIVHHFNEQELRTLCFDMDVDYESLSAQGKEDKVRELVALFERRCHIPELVQQCRELRPKVSWPEEVPGVEPAPPELPKPQHPQPPVHTLQQRWPIILVIAVVAVAALAVLLAFILRPALRYEVSAWVFIPDPDKQSNQTVFGKLTKDGAGVVGAQMYCVAHYKTTTSRWPEVGQQVTSEDGVASVTFNIGAAAANVTVDVDVYLTYEGKTYQATTSFTPRY